MLERINTLFLILPLILIYLGVQNLLQAGRIERSLTLEVPQNIGIDEELMSKIDQLEKDITRRVNYEVELTRDPLKLNSIFKVSNGTGRRKEFEEKKRALRLSCTILSPKGSTAVIKHRSKSYVVKAGDSILEYKVKSITKKQVILVSENGELILHNKPAPRIEAYFDKKHEEEALNL